MQEMYEMWVQSLGWKDPLVDGMATCSIILAWKILRMEESPWGHKELNTTKHTYANAIKK